MEIKLKKDLGNQVWVNLIDKSLEARKRAYCKYSNFQVGAAVLLSDGSVVLGSNVENASYGLTICAERCAFVKAISDGLCGPNFGSFEVIAVSAVSPNEIVTPCGACRQFMSEFCSKKDLRVLLYNPDLDKVGVTTLNYLLPESYHLQTSVSSANGISNGSKKFSN